MESLNSVKTADKLPLPPIASLLPAKCKKPPPQQCKKTPPVFIPTQVESKNISPLLIQTNMECNTSSPSPKCGKMLNSPTAMKSNTVPPISSPPPKCGKMLNSPTAMKSNTVSPISSPPPPPHLLCGLSNVQTFQQSPTQGLPVGSRGMPIPGGMAPYLSGGFLDPSSIGSTNMPCGPNFQYQQTNFGEVSTLACQTIIYQNTSIITPRSGFRSSISNHPSAWRSHLTSYSSPEAKGSPKSKKMKNQSPSTWTQDALKPKNCRPISVHSAVLDQNQFSRDEDLDHLKEAGLHATDFSSIPPRSQHLVPWSHNSHKADSNGKLFCIPIDVKSQKISATPKRPTLGDEKEISSQKSKDVCKSNVTCDKREEKDGSDDSSPRKNTIFPVCPTLLADATKFNNSAGTAKHSNPNRSGFNVSENSEFNLFPYPKIDEIESVGSNDLGVDNAEYHPIALPLGCYQFNDSDTESDTTTYEGSLGRRMAKMGQDKFDLHLDKTLTFMEWKLIPITKEPTNKPVSDDARYSQQEDPRFQQPLEGNKISKDTCKNLTPQLSLDGNQENQETFNDLTNIGSMVPRDSEFGQQETHPIVGSKDGVGLDKQIEEVLDVSLSVSYSQDDLHKVSENNDVSQSSGNKNFNPDTETVQNSMEIGTGTKNSSETETSRISGAPEVKSPGADCLEEVLAVSTINERSNGVLTTTSDLLSTSGEVSTEHQSRRSSFSDTSDIMETHQGNPLARIATVLSQNLSKTSKDKIGKNVERLSQNISSVMQKVKGMPETTAITNNIQKHETFTSDASSDTITKAQIKEDTLVMTITRQHNKSNVSTSKNGCVTPVPKKKELPPLWNDSKSCNDHHQDKMSSQEKRLLQESADFLGEDFSAFSRRSQRKRGVPKKLENYFSECREVSEDFQTAANKRKRQRTNKDTEDTNSTSDRTDHDDSNWNMVELYQDDVVVEDRNNLATVSGVETNNQGTRPFEKSEKYTEVDIDEEFLLKSTPKCTRNMLKKLTSSLINSSNHHGGTVLRSRKALPASTTTEDNTPSPVDSVAETISGNPGNSASDDASGPLLTNPITLETESDLIMKGTNANLTTAGKSDRGTALVNSGPVTQTCTVYITQEDTVKDVQTQTNGHMTCAGNSQRMNISTTGDMATTHAFGQNKRNRNKLKGTKSKKNVSHSQVSSKKKKGRPFKNIASSKEAAMTCLTDSHISSNGREKQVTVENGTADTTKLTSTDTSEETSLSSNKKTKSKEARKNSTSLSAGKPKKSKMEKKKNGDLPSQNSNEDAIATDVLENITKSIDVEKSKKKNVTNEQKKEDSVGDAAKQGSKKKVQVKKQKTKEKADDSNLSKDQSPQTSKKVDTSKQNCVGEETTTKKKKKVLKNDTDDQKQMTSWKSRKGSGERFPSHSKILEKNISNLVAKNKKAMLAGFAKFHVVTDPNRAAAIMSNGPTECRFCKKTITFSALKDHEREHKVKCIQCCLVFDTKKERNEHLLKKHSTSKNHGKVVQVTKDIKVNEWYHCMLCEKSFASMKMFQRHLHSSIHGYNRHIQNRCLSMMESHTERSSRASQRRDTLSIDNGAQEASSDDRLVQHAIKWTEGTSPKMWTLPENQTTMEEIKKQLTKTVEHADGQDNINYYYYEPEFLEWMKKQERLKLSALPNSDMHQRSEPYAVVTNFSMMNYLTSGPQCASVKYVPEEEGESSQHMHNSSADDSTSYTPPRDQADDRDHFLPISTTGYVTNGHCDGSAMASSSFLPPYVQDDGSNFHPNGGSVVNYPTLEPSNKDTNLTDSNKNTTPVGVPFTNEQSVIHNESSPMSSQNTFGNSYQCVSEERPSDQPTLNNSRILSTSSSDHDPSDMDQDQMGWLSRAIQDIEADPYYQVSDFLDSQSDLDNDSGFNEHAVSQDTPISHITNTQSTSETVVTRNYTDLDNGQQIQVRDTIGLETGRSADVCTDILSRRCLNNSQENSFVRGSEPSVSCTLSPAELNYSKRCYDSQINDEIDEDDPESQELLTLKYAQILCDIRNDVLGTRSYQE